jgi:beta-barrel assembly-enhancing protease
MKKLIYAGLVLLAAVPFSLESCKDKDGEGPSINLFSVQDDISFGAEVAAEIDADPTTYPLLDSAQYPAAYGHINRIKDTILNSGKLKHKDDFVWRIRIIRDDSTLNAFCTPGGTSMFTQELLNS